MPNSIRPGDVLADRYDLVDLLVESGGGRFWRAHDRVLDRHVALHVLAEDDERAEGLLEAARQSATVQDRRLLRVLDADRVDGLCYVVNEWGSGSSLDILLATDGPMTPRRAAWLVSEVAACVAAGHSAGTAHGRLVPENVLVDATGSVRVIGYGVDAALHGLPAGRLSADLADLGGLLYSALTGRWPGVSRSQVPGAPDEHGRVLRPRQVRAGIPRPLDQLCDRLVNPYAGHGSAERGDAHDLTTSRGVADYLAEFVGDPAGLAADEARQQAQRSRPRPGGSVPAPPGGSVVLPAGATMALRAVDASEAAGTANGSRPAQTPTETPTETETETETAADDTGQGTADQAPEPGAEPDATSAPPPPAGDLPTQAGMPVFDDEIDEVSWLRARSTPPPPPPPFEELPERPLFAPEPAAGEPVRKPRAGAAVGAGGHDYWPWDTSTGTGIGTGSGSGVIPVTDEDEEDGRVPGRRWLRLALVLGLSLVLLLAVVVAFNLGRGRSPLGAVPEDRPSTPSASPQASATPITGLSATDLDPQGNPPEEYPELTGLAVDGDPGTAWRTSTYDQDFGPAGLKTGVGLVVDLGSEHQVSSVDLTFIGAPTSASLFLSDQAPTAVAGMTPAAKVKAGQEHAHVTLSDSARGRYLTIWLTSLPAVDGGFRGEVAEVAVRG